MTKITAYMPAEKRRIKMDARPIGIFDSGLGGLTTVKKLTELMPEESIIYLGDTARIPYGSRSRDTIIKYARQDAAFLMQFDIKAMVIACNTVCSSAPVAEIMAGSQGFPVYEVVSAPARAAVQKTKNGIIGVIGTKATIRSGAYEKALKSFNPALHVLTAACPLFVPLIEDGAISWDDDITYSIAELYLSPIRASGADTLLLGCTHYPLLRGVISKVMGPPVSLIDSGEETARLVSAGLKENGMLSPAGRAPEIKYYVTDSISGFEELATKFLESDVRGKVEQAVLE